MGQVTTTQTFNDGMTLTAADLTAILANSTLDPTAITSQVNETTVASGDSIIIHDTSAAALREVTIGDLFARPTAIGGTTPAAVTGTTITGTTYVGPQVAKYYGHVTCDGTGAVTGVAGYNIAGGVAKAVPTGTYTISLNPNASTSTYALSILGRRAAGVIWANVTTQGTANIVVEFRNSAGNLTNPDGFSYIIFNLT